MISQVDLSDLSPRLGTLAEIIGLAEALRLVEKRGGTRIYIPEVADPDHWLADVIGTSSLANLVKHYARESIEIDRGCAALRAVRDRLIICRYSEGRASTAALALEFGLTQRQIFNILARDASVLDQMDLFGNASN